MVYKGNAHLEMDDDWGYPYDLGNPHMDKRRTNHVGTQVCSSFTQVRSEDLRSCRFREQQDYAGTVVNINSRNP